MCGEMERKGKEGSIYVVESMTRHDDLDHQFMYGWHYAG